MIVSEKIIKTRMKKQPDGYAVCQGCGEKLYPEYDLYDVEYVKTKRGSELFFHTECLGAVWRRRICVRN